QDIQVGCAHILLRLLETIREDAFLGHRRHVDLRGTFGCASRTCLEPSWVLRVMGDRCHRLRSRREVGCVSLRKFSRIALCCLLLSLDIKGGSLDDGVAVVGSAGGGGDGRRTQKARRRKRGRPLPNIGGAGRKPVSARRLP
ncbi:uncharacterized protein SCHCODRAFT_02490537, partial [Schizophyllum commune H4-8]|uniref:uncharacterized protein n=1 Tax=Schizophyllum commune (strain H4-8 / FGSC 9210) TaxID=578458 RepID=UPI00215FEE2C